MNSVTGLGSWKQLQGMPLWGVVEPRSQIEAHHCHMARSSLEVTSIQYQRSARNFFFKKVLNILDSLDCHFYTKLLIQYTEF